MMRINSGPVARVFVGVVALVGAACGGGDDDALDEPPGDCTPVATAGAVVNQDSLKFEPNTLCVTTGREVVFTNSENALHTVTIEGKNESGTMKKGDDFRWTPAQAGAYKITCEFHPQMKAVVTALP